MNHQVKAAGKKARFVCVFDPNRTTIYLRAERKEKLGETASLLTQMSQHTQMRKILPWPTQDSSLPPPLHWQPITNIPVRTEPEKPFNFPPQFPEPPG